MSYLWWHVCKSNRCCFAHDDEMALGAVESIKASGRDIIVVGFDATADAKAAVIGASMAATVEQLPKMSGALVLKMP